MLNLTQVEVGVELGNNCEHGKTTVKKFHLLQKLRSKVLNKNFEQKL